MWVKRGTLESVKQDRDGWKKRCEEERDKPKIVKFSDYYAERMEYWRGRFKLKQEKHQIEVSTSNGDSFVEEYDNIDVLGKRSDMIRDAIDNAEGFVIFSSTTLAVAHVVSVETYLGHPEPYTQAEIDSWAKEKVEAEMQGWEVAKKEIHGYYITFSDGSMTTSTGTPSFF